METKDQLIQTIKEWVKLDNETCTLKQELNTRNKEKKLISEKLIVTMKENEIDCFDIKGGQICYNKKNIKKPINTKQLLDVLSKFYNGDLLKAAKLNEFILDSREEIVKESIVHKIAKP
jgi:hypothetical protein